MEYLSILTNRVNSKFNYHVEFSSEIEYDLDLVNDGTLDELIGSGEPTRGESRILEGIASGDESVTAENIEDIVSLAPYLKPSVLTKLSL